MSTDTGSQFRVFSHSNSDHWEDNPANPRQWSLGRKWQAMGIISLYTLSTTMGTSMMAPALLEIAKRYDITNSTILAMTVSISSLSVAFGPLFIAPLSEMYGRTWVLHIGNLAHAVMNLGCAYSPTLGSLLAFRFLAGLAASTPIAVVGGSINDLFSDRERAVAMAVYSPMALIGTFVFPIAGGFIAQNLGVKYVFIAMSLSCGVAAAIGIPCLRETYAPVICLRLAKRPADLEKLAQTLAPTGNKSTWHNLRLNLTRPMVLLTRSLICFMLSLYIALIFGIFSLMFITFSSLFSGVYHFSHGVIGLAFLGPGIGCIVGITFSGWISNKLYKTLADKNGGNGKPEMRIPSMIFGTFFIPVGLLWYGWSAAARIHWIMPMIGASIFGFGWVTVLVQARLYIVDAFAFPASALSAAAVFESLLGFTFPLFGQDMYIKLGYGGGTSLLASLAVVIGIPFPIWVWYKGEGIRKRSAVFMSQEGCHPGSSASLQGMQLTSSLEQDGECDKEPNSVVKE
ncbi:hypothetical protein PILCRDRAFT_72101 [Piloderma croceum F 1598]|uniref:Major facilitator superfamily (MFS) profile domain-containing protein n=1 Tax=Piloderma croceum (strain F 1598) TaxID=765440 RepID=A0A0C3F9D7_PILCF|nr:hypothetical protein PILCRDRAFT_72101 [Piloderma croceum F 1598]